MVIWSIAVVLLLFCVSGWMIVFFQRYQIRVCRRENILISEQIDSLSQSFSSSKEEIQRLLLEQGKNEVKLQVYEEQKKQSQETFHQMKLEFSRISQEILKEQGTHIQKASEDKLLSITRPLGEQLTHFHQKVESYEKTHLMDKGRFETMLGNLQTGVQNFSNVFSKDIKVRGTWGEQQLVRVLEDSGLAPGRDFQTQVSIVGEDGERYIPDVLLVLPYNQHIIIDAKTPFNNFQCMQNSTSIEERDIFHKKFLEDIRKHISELGSKDYTRGTKKKKSLQSPALSLLFLPIESAYITAMESPKIIEEARRYHILLCSPSTLWGVATSIAQIWQMYQQNQNAVEIFAIARQIVEKVDIFQERVDGLDKNIKSLQITAQELRKPLEGQGGVLSFTRKLEDLGIKNSRMSATEKSRKNPSAPFVLSIPFQQESNNEDSNDYSSDLFREEASLEVEVAENSPQTTDH